MRKYFFILVLSLLILSGCDNKVLHKGKTLKVGTNAPYEPMEFFGEDNSLTGIDIEIIKEIANSLSYDIEIKNYGWEELFKAIENKEIDVAIASITITPERAKKYLFTRPYFNAGQTLVVRKSSSISSLMELKERKVGVQNQTTSMEEALKYSKHVITYKDSYKDAIKDLIDGKIDAIIIDYPSALSIINKHTDLKIVGEPFTDEFYGMIVSDPELLPIINEKIAQMLMNGKIDRIISKYIEYKK